jgi:hypothetical protein
MMALDIGELLVSIKTDLTQLNSGLSDANNRLDNFGAGAVAKGTLIADSVKKFGGEILRFSYDCVKAYGENEQAVARLETALKNQGLETKLISKDLQAYAGELQKTSQYSDETSLEMMALLTTFGLTGDEMKKTLKSAMDLSTGLGIDLRTATMMLGKAAMGETGTLARYGIVIGDNVPKAQRFEEVLRQVNDRFGGATAANMQTVIGKITSLTNRMDDLKEQVGKRMIPIFEFWMKQLEKSVSYIERLAGAEQEGLKGRELTIDSLERQKTAIIEGHRAMEQQLMKSIEWTEQEKQRIASIDKAINSEKKLSAAEAKSAKDSIATGRSRAKAIKGFLDDEAAEKAKALAKESAATDTQTASMMAKYMSRNQMMIALQTTFTARQASILNNYLSISEQQELLSQTKKLEAQGKYDDAKALKEAAVRDATMKQEEDIEAFRQLQNKNRMQNLSTALNFISTLQSSKNKEMAAVGKAAAISQATIDTYSAATAAFKAMAGIPYVGPVLGAIAAAAAIAAGMANVAKITGVKLAKGGIVMPQDGGVQATIGEAGSAEAVIPLDDPRAKKALAGASGGGGGDIHVHISGQFIEGSPSKMQRLVRETLVPGIRRYTDISPKGPFARRRGRSS